MTSTTKKAAAKQRRKWSLEEVNAVEEHMKESLRTFTVPNKKSCDLCLQRAPETLKDRSWKDVKNFVRNKITSLKKQVKTN